MMNVGGIVLQLLGGFFFYQVEFSVLSYRVSHLIMVVFMLPEPEKKEQVIVEKAAILECML